MRANNMQWIPDKLDDAEMVFKELQNVGNDDRMIIQNEYAMSSIYSFLLWFSYQSQDRRLFAIGEYVFQVSPISTALLSEGLEYFKKAMHVRTYNDGRNW